VDRRNPKGRATPGAKAIAIEPFDDFFDAERARGAIPVQIQLEMSRAVSASTGSAEG
jgi:hypothetical protein